MKLFIAVLLQLSFLVPAYSAPLKPTELSPELGESLGFHVFRYETKLNPGEVLVVTEIVAQVGEKTVEMETAFQGGEKAIYPVSLVDGGAYHPSLRNTYTLRSGSGTNKPLQNLWLTGTANGNDGAIEFKFSELQTNNVQVTCRWHAEIEKFSDVAQRWPGLKQPAAGFGIKSQRVLQPSFDKANPRN